MSSPDRRRVLALGAALSAALALSACGFTPALREDAPGASLQNSVSLILPEGRLGFALRETLERRLGRPQGTAPYTLTSAMTVVESGLAVTQDTSITRYVVRGVAPWRLEDANGETRTGEVEAMSAYSATGSLFATREARRDAEDRVARELGEKINDALIAAFAAPPA